MKKPEPLHPVEPVFQVEKDVASGKPLITVRAALTAWGGEAVDAAVRAGRLRPIPGAHAYLILAI